MKICYDMAMKTMVEKYKNNEPISSKDGLLKMNPEKSEITSLIAETRRKGGMVIMEIGPGRSSGVGLKSNDLYIGIEPNFEGELSFAINRAELGAEVVIVDDFFRLPELEPDLVLCFAPNPRLVVEGNILWDYEYPIRKAGVVVFALDTRTREANSGSGVKGFVRKVENDLREMGRRGIGREAVSGSISELLDDLGVGRDCNLNSSADLGGRAVVIFSDAR